MKLRIPVAILSVSLVSGFAQLTGNPSERSSKELLSRTDPQYSDEARLAELEGSVVVTGTARGDGYPTDLRVSQSLGLGLDQKAIEAVQQWQFQPGTDSIRVAVDFSLPSKLSRWHLIGVDFRPPEGSSRPTVVSAYYPGGAGVFNSEAIEEGRLLGAMGRQAFVTLSFDVDEKGVPVHIQAVNSSDSVWDDQATAVLRGWRFAPGMKNGVPVSVPCTFDLAWGPRNLGSTDVARLYSALHPAPAPRIATTVPAVVYSPDPQYPVEARDAGLEGTVTAVLNVGEDGTPGNIRVLQGLGGEIDKSVTDALGRWRFNPPLLNGQPARISLVIAVKFELPDRVSSRVGPPPRTVKVASVR